MPIIDLSVSVEHCLRRLSMHVRIHCMQFPPLKAFRLLLCCAQGMNQGIIPLRSLIPGHLKVSSKYCLSNHTPRIAGSQMNLCIWSCMRTFNESSSIHSANVLNDSASKTQDINTAPQTLLKSYSSLMCFAHS